MDPTRFSDLSEAARLRVAAAEIEADSIVDRGRVRAFELSSEAYRMGVDPSGVGYSPGDVPLSMARHGVEEAIDTAAGHLFGAIAKEYLTRGSLDPQELTLMLGKVGAWILQKYPVAPAIVDELKSYCQSIGLRRRADNLEGAEVITASSLNQSSVDGTAGDSFLERVGKLVPPDDPYFAQLTRFYLASGIAEHSIAEQAHAGTLTFPDWLDGQIRVIQEGTDVKIAAIDSVADIPVICRELDDDAVKYIAFLEESVPLNCSPDEGGILLEELRNRISLVTSGAKRRAFEIGLKIENTKSEAAAHGSPERPQLQPDQPKPHRAKLEPHPPPPLSATEFSSGRLESQGRAIGTMPASFTPSEITLEVGATAIPVVEAQGEDIPPDWESIEISFLSDERVQIRRGRTTETRNYAEFGFGDKRDGKPKQAWTMMRLLAQASGTISDSAKAGGADWTKVEKRIEEIRREFRKHFCLVGDPIPFVEGFGYRAKFKIRCGGSFHT